MNLVQTESEDELPEPVKKCIKSPKFLNDFVNCFNSGNYAQYLTAPTLVIQSPYDQYCLKNIVYARCVSASQPSNLDKCDDASIAAIEDYHKEALKGINGMRSNKTGSGVFAAWGPACIQHGFSAESSLNSNRFRIPSGTGETLSSVLTTFIRDTNNTPWLLENIIWPNNQGCSGKNSNLRENIFEENIFEKNILELEE